MQLGLPTPTARPQQVTFNGVLSARSLGSLQREEAAQATARAEQARNQPVVSSLVEYVRRHWAQAKNAKVPIECEMLSAVRSRRGEYDPDKLAHIRRQGGSEIYMMVFATKARQLKALLVDILAGNGPEKPWTLTPTPSPDLPPELADQIMRSVYDEAMQSEMSGTPLSVEEMRQRMVDMKSQMHKRVQEQAQADAEQAELEVEDVLVEGGFIDALDQFVDDLAVFKTAIFKGPVVRQGRALRWVPGPDGRHVAQVSQVTKRVFERVDPFMIYPAPHATSVHDAYLFERHKLTRSDLSAMIGVEGYNEDALRAVLNEHGTGGLNEWLIVDTSRIEAEGRVLARQAGQFAEHLPGVERHLAVGVNLAAGHRHAVHQHPVLVGRQVEVVADVHGRHQEPEFLRLLAADRLDTRHQITALRLVDQRDQPEADLQPQRVERAHLLPAQFTRRTGRAGRGQRGPRGGLGGLRLLGLVAAVEQPGDVAEAGGEAQEGEVRHARDQADETDDAGGEGERPVERLLEAARECWHQSPIVCIGRSPALIFSPSRTAKDADVFWQSP